MGLPDRASKSASPGSWNEVVLSLPVSSLQSLGPSTPLMHASTSSARVWTLPLSRMMPLSKPMLPAPPLNAPAALLAPV